MTMRIQLLFFALYRDMAGVETLEIEVPAGSTARGLVGLVRERGGGLARLPAEPVVAINREYASLDAHLSDGDELALLPPVAGG